MTADLSKAVKRCSKPETVALLVVRDRAHGRSDIMPLGWKMWASSQPRLVAFSVHQDHYSCDLLLAEGECTLAWPDQRMIDGVLKCGTVSGHEADKPEMTGWRLLPARFVGAGLIEEAIVNLECRVKDRLETGDHMLFVCSVIEGHVAGNDERPIFTLNDEAIFSHSGRAKGFKFGTFK